MYVKIDENFEKYNARKNEMLILAMENNDCDELL